MYANYIKSLNYKLQDLFIAERMRSIGQVNVENQVPYRCHMTCNMDRFMVIPVDGDIVPVSSQPNSVRPTSIESSFVEVISHYKIFHIKMMKMK